VNDKSFRRRLPRCRQVWHFGAPVTGAILLLLSFFLPFALAQETRGKELLWGSDAEGGAPYIFKDPNNPERNIGFEVDLVDALSRELNRPIRFQQYDFKNLVPGLKRGDFDFAMDGLEVTPDRQEQVRFSRPYYVYKLQLVTRVQENRFQTLKGCQKLAGMVVGTMEDTAAERLLDQLKISKKIYDGPVEAYQDLSLGRIDAVLLDLPIAIYYAKGDPKLKFVGQPTGKGYYAIAFTKENEALATQVDAALGRLMQTGELRRIYRRWHLWNDNQEELMPAGVFEENEEHEEEQGNILEESRQKWTLTRYLPLLAEYALVTIRLSALSFCLAIAIGLPVALLRLYGPSPLSWLATTYVEFFRGIPVLLLLVFLYFGLADLGQYYRIPLGMTSFQAALLGLGLNYAAYEAEIYRAGIQSIPVGQWEAAASLGMSRPLTFRRIILPQAVRTILPPMTSDFVALFKDTSVASAIALVELTKQYQILSKSSMKYLEVGLVTAALYLIMSVPLGHLSRYLEKRLHKSVGA
jgi:polar amino acid transport system substrate-binding protein